MLDLRQKGLSTCVSTLQNSSFEKCGESIVKVGRFQQKPRAVWQKSNQKDWTSHCWAEFFRFVLHKMDRMLQILWMIQTSGDHQLSFGSWYLPLFNIIYKVLAPSQLVSRISEPSTGLKNWGYRRTQDSGGIQNPQKMWKTCRFFFREGMNREGGFLINRITTENHELLPTSMS